MLKKLLSVVSLVFLLATSTAQADIVVTGLSADDDVCNHVAGLWKGESDVSLYGLPCHYNGTANITALSDPKTYNLDVNLTGGNHVWCPDESIMLSGSCDKGKIIIRADNANLDGSLDSTGTAAHLHGDVYVTKMRIKVTVKDINVHKIN